MTARHVIARRDINFVQLRAEFRARLGSQVEIIARPATDEDAGEFSVEGPDGELLDLDPGLVDEVLLAHTPQPSEQERLLAAFDAANTPAAKLEVMRQQLVSQSSREQRIRSVQAALAAEIRAEMQPDRG